LRNSASRWFLLEEYITMHCPLNVKFTILCDMSHTHCHSYPVVMVTVEVEREREREREAVFSLRCTGTKEADFVIEV